LKLGNVAQKVPRRTINTAGIKQLSVVAPVAVKPSQGIPRIAQVVAKPVVKPVVKAAVKPEVKPVVKAAVKPVVKPVVKAAVKP
jgi:hypothetical protein